jgi:hypothetical protein
MADYYEQGTVSPFLNLDETIAGVLALLHSGEMEDYGPYIFENVEDQDEETDDNAAAYMKENPGVVQFLREMYLLAADDGDWEYYEVLAGLNWEPADNGTVYLFFEDGYPRWLEYFILQCLNHLGDKAPEWVEIQTAHTCSRMRPDGFGGSAIVIHKSGAIKYMSTASWAEKVMSDGIDLLTEVLEGDA